MHVGPLSMRTCPYCSRSFNEQAAQRHIPVCMKTKNRPKPPPTKYDIYSKSVSRQQDLKKVESKLKSAKSTSFRQMSQKNSSRTILRTSIEFNKIKETKDTVAELVSSDILKELQKERESPFLRRESNR